jgi:hypothetical protein
MLLHIFALEQIADRGIGVDQNDLQLQQSRAAPAAVDIDHHLHGRRLLHLEIGDGLLGLGFRFAERLRRCSPSASATTSSSPPPRNISAPATPPRIKMIAGKPTKRMSFFSPPFLASSPPSAPSSVSSTGVFSLFGHDPILLIPRRNTPVSLKPLTGDAVNDPFGNGARGQKLPLKAPDGQKRAGRRTRPLPRSHKNNALTMARPLRRTSKASGRGRNRRPARTARRRPKQRHGQYDAHRADPSADLRRAMDVTANNIANAQTTGFKAERVMLAENSDSRARHVDGPNRVAFVDEWALGRDFTQGTLQQTGRPLDLALEGEGLFTLQTEAGERFTRDGSFTLNADGRTDRSRRRAGAR